jgi:uncharacterized membrane protein YfcA
LTLEPETLVLLLASGVVAGGIGAMTGIGGGLLLVPTLVLGFGVPVRVAVATSLVAVVATSNAAGSVYVDRGLTNMRLAMTLELATTLGAIAGGISAALLSERFLAGAFAAVTLLTAGSLLKRGTAEAPSPVRTALAEAKLEGRGYEERGRLAGAYLDELDGRMVDYVAGRLPVGLAVSFVAGGMSGLLGVGGGFLKVPAMHLGMGVPMKVAAATSNFMIGVTAAASLSVFYQRGFLHPLVAAPVALGVLLGALVGTRLQARSSARVLTQMLAVLLLVGAVQMSLKSLGVWFGE